MQVFDVYRKMIDHIDYPKRFNVIDDFFFNELVHTILPLSILNIDAFHVLTKKLFI